MLWFRRNLSIKLTKNLKPKVYTDWQVELTKKQESSFLLNIEAFLCKFASTYRTMLLISGHRWFALHSWLVSLAMDGESMEANMFRARWAHFRHEEIIFKGEQHDKPMGRRSRSLNAEGNISSAQR